MNRGVPADIVFGDVSLRVMARDYPTTEREMENITGVGVKKPEDFGAQFLDAIIRHLRENPRQAFLDLAAGCVSDCNGGAHPESFASCRNNGDMKNE